MNLKSGRQTMSDAIRESHRYHRYSYDKVKDFLGMRSVEFGCAWGMYTGMMLDDGIQVLGLDLDADCIDYCRSQYESRGAQFLCGDVCGRQNLEAVSRFRPDSILMMQVLEHIEDDAELLTGLRHGCGKQTRLVICAPAFQALFGPMDKQAGHFRRYSLKSLEDVLRRTGWEPEQGHYVNPIGAVGWWLNNRVFKRWTSLNAGHVNAQIRLFDKFILPLSRILEKPFSRHFGQTVVITARKTA